jgi:LCP family protein required for cell wall assembly
MNGPFAVPQTPRPPFQQAGGPGSFAGPMGMPGMGNVQTPNPAWSNQRGPQGRLPEKNTIPSAGNRGRKKRRVPIWARVVIGFLLFVLVLGGTTFACYQFTLSGSVSHIVGQTVARTKGEDNANANLTNGILTGPRVNILLLGSDTDQKFQHSYLAQTDIVVTIDPASHAVGMLSIPRDFFMNVPGYGLHKLDEAYSLGGLALSRLTIEQDFGIPINYYAWVGLDGFMKVINEVGGVDVDVLHPIVDDNYPDDVGANANDPNAVKRLDLSPGPQHLDGSTALEYVRSRHADLLADFGRSARQQQVLSALKNKLANPDIFSHLSAIANDLNGYLKTDMQLPDILKLMNFARSLDVNKINKLILGPPYSHSGTAPAGSGIDSGQSVVFPTCPQIIPAIAQMLQLGNNAACNVQGPPGRADSSYPQLASTSGQSLPLAYTTGNAPADLGNLSASATVGLGNGPTDLFGIQGLLDLMLMGVFESPSIL